MAAYCRVSTDQLEQLSSYEAQVAYYTNYIDNHPDYELAGIYADEGISGTNTKKREQFNRMIGDCKAGKIDMIITKSISRFARNTLDTLNYVRTLKELGIGVLFEKENINTLDSKGEVLLTILSSLAQDESRSISENSTWGIRRKFEQGKVIVNHKKFLGYDKDEDGNLVINEKQAKIVKRIYKDFLNGKGANRIAKELEEERIQNWNGTTKWYVSSIRKMLTNEKYKGDAILQKTYTVDFLTKKRVENKGEVPMYYVEESHPAIIDKEMWEAVQLEMERRKNYVERYGLTKIDYSCKENPFSGKVICGCCGSIFGRKVWNSTDERLRRYIWRCNRKYEIKGKKICENKHIDDKVLYEVFINTFNMMLENKDYFIKKWEEHLDSDDLLKKYKAKQFIKVIEKVESIEKFNTDLFNIFIEKMVVFDGGKIMLSLIDGMEIECDIKIR
ncbi:DNA invertase Pin-like site-specific DNA recombinase [Natranaerovirga pectinivora]|uniref:DNA invertase Pin-like site-specific DNA recombinase n=1 Tax=Natranaerovirga pectinivora TaxID=682400 RepID=A0A4R3MLI3_9FIRM|nr:recombinase family protein [Natranaerovirga pectinivora]TCT14537.1 DNA invertase Pin-like site-specific DNA recombinase [Natranaerovirga pectinivora]